jgi:hypothetical protein
MQFSKHVLQRSLGGAPAAVTSQSHEVTPWVTSSRRSVAMVLLEDPQGRGIYERSEECANARLPSSPLPLKFCYARHGSPYNLR